MSHSRPYFSPFFAFSYLISSFLILFSGLSFVLRCDLHFNCATLVSQLLD